MRPVTSEEMSGIESRARQILLLPLTVRLFTDHLEWRAALSRLAESPGAGPASPGGSVSMPEGPRADLLLSTVGGLHQAVKEVRTKAEELGV